MDPYNKSFKVGVGEERAIAFICRIRSVEVGCYEFFKGIKTLSPSSVATAAKKVAQTSKCDRPEGSRILKIRRVVKKHDEYVHSSIKSSEIFGLWETRKQI